MAHQDQSGPRSDGLSEPIGQVVEARRRQRKGDLPDDDPLAPFALPQRREHAGVVVRRRQDLVSAAKLEPQQAGLHRLGGVAGDGDLLAVAAEGGGQPGSDRLDLRLEDPPHRVRRRLIREVEVAAHRLHDDARRGGHAAVVEVDDRAVDGVRLLDLAPEGLVTGDVLRRGALRLPTRREDGFEPTVSIRRGHASAASPSQKRAPRCHGSPSVEDSIILLAGELEGLRLPTTSLRSSSSVTSKVATP